MSADKGLSVEQGYDAAVARVEHYASESNGRWDIQKLMQTAQNLREDKVDALEGLNAQASAATPAEPSPNGCEGHRKPCYYCGKPCNDLAGNPSQWSLGFPHRDEPGKVKWQHVGCVLERLIENQPAASPVVQEGLEAPQKEYKHWLWCNGDRRVPAGEPGHTCCCFNLHPSDAQREQVEALIAKYKNAAEESRRIFAENAIKMQRGEMITFTTTAGPFQPIEEVFQRELEGLAEKLFGKRE